MLGLYYESNYQGILVRHIPQKKFKNSIMRMIGFIHWHITSFFLCLFEKKIDIILSPSPPLTLGLLNIVLGKLKGAKVIYNVQEIYPDLLIERGNLKSKKIISLLNWLEKFVYNNSDKVTTIDKIFYDTIVERFDDESKLKIIPNFVDTSIYKPFPSASINIDKKYFPDTSSLKLMYAGNIGHAQDWETLVNIAIQLKKEKIEFFIIGEGVQKDFLTKEIITHGLNKVHLIPYQNRNSMPSLIAYSDLQFIFMTPQTDCQGFPTKVYTIMACAKSMIVCSGENTPIINFLKDKDCAFLIEEKDLNKKSNQIVYYLKSIVKSELKEMGKNGCSYINQRYSKDAVVGSYINLANSLLN